MSHRRTPLSRRLVGWFLRSPLSGLLDRAVMLITIRGRRTGSAYTFPVQYATADGTIWVLPGHHEGKTWWLNVVSETSVDLWLRGRGVAATAQAFLGQRASSVVQEGLGIYVRRFPAFGRRSGLVKLDGTINEAAVRELASRTVMVRIHPSTPGETAQKTRRTVAGRVEGRRLR